MSDQASNQCVP
jgi:hypothetical protein